MKNKLKFGVLALLVTLATVSLGSIASALPSTLHWTYSGWAGGGAFPNIVPDPNNNGKVYLLSDVGGVWTSSNRGDQWNYITKGLKNYNNAILAISNSNPSVMYIASEAGIHKTTDSGQNWTYLTATDQTITFWRGDNYKSLVIDRLDPNKVYAGNKNGEVFSTADGGTTWARVGAVTYPMGQAGPIKAMYLSRDGSSLFAGSDSGLKRFDFASNTWQSVGISGTAVTDIVGHGFTETIYITYGKKVAYTTDKGATWQYSSDIPIWNGIVFRFSVTTGAQGQTKIAAAWRENWNGGVVLSNDKGVNWTDIERNLNHDVVNDPTRVWAQGMGWPLCINFDPNNSDIIYFGDHWGVWRTDDSGANWYEKIVGAANTVGSDIAVAADGSLLVGTMDNGLLKSTDNGATYKALIPNASVNGDYINGHMWRVITQGNKIIATNSPWNSNRNQILISNDGGATFTITSTGLPTSYPTGNTMWDKGYARALAADPKNPNRLYLGIDGDNGGGLFISDNGGSSWTRSAGQPGWLQIYNGLAVDPVETNRIYWAACGTQGGVYKSENSGQSWTRVFNSSYWVFDLVVAKNGTVYAAGSSGGPKLYVSTDKGNTWGMLKAFPGSIYGTAEAITIDPNNPQRIAVGTVEWGGYGPNRIFMTEDGGTNWTDITSDMPDGQGASAMTFSPDSSSLFVTRYAGSVYRLQFTPSGPDTTAPATPVNVAAAASNGQANITWSASADNVGTTGYNIFRDGAPLAAVNFAVQFTDASVTAGSTYTYTVSAFDAAGNTSAQSAAATVSIPVPDTAAPTAPAGLTAALSGSQVNLAWTASTDNVAVTGYNIYQGATQIGTSSSASFAHTPITAGAVYNYTVKAKDAAGNLSAASNSVSFTVPNTVVPADAPQNLSFTQDSVFVNFAWQTPQNFQVFGYNIYKNGQYFKTVSGTWGYDQGLAVGSTNSYYVRAYNAASVLSSPSNTVTVVFGTQPAADTTAPTAPGITQYSTLNGSATIDWTASTDNVGVTGYQVIRDGAQIATTTSTSYTATSLTLGSNYVFTVKAYDAAGNYSAASNAVTINTGTDTMAPTAPANLSATVAATSASLSWSASTDNVSVAGYQIFNGASLVSTTGATNYTVTGLQPSTAYTFTVKAYDVANNFSQASNAVTVTTPAPADTAAPGVPAGLTATVSGSQIVLGWSASTDNTAVTGYQVFRGASMLSTVTGTAYTDANPVPGTTYSYTVKALDAANNISAASAAATATVPSTGLPADAPRNMTSTQDSTFINFSWQAPLNFQVFGYNIYKNDQYFKTVSGTWGYDQNVPVGTTNSYYVRAYNAASVLSSPSNTVSVTFGQAPAPDTTAPTAPSLLIASAGTNAVTLSWQAATDNIAVTGYQIFNGASLVSTTTATSFTVTGLQPDTTYSFTAKAYDAAGNTSAPSNTATATTPALTDTTAPSAPIGITAAVVGSQINVSWLPSSDNVAVTGYQVLRNSAVIGTVSTTSYSDMTPAAGTTYSYTAKAFDAAGNISASSITVTATVPNNVQPAGAPTGLAATQDSTFINFTWTAPVNFQTVGYNIYRNGSYLKTVGTPYGWDNTMAAGSTNSYYVRAYDASSALSPASNTVTVTFNPPPPADTTAPTVPTSLRATAGTSSIALSWTASTDAVGVTGYNIYRNNSLLAAVTNTSYNDLAVTAGTAYTYRVDAVDAAGNRSARSGSVTASLQSTAPQILTLGVSNVTRNEAKVNWTTDRAATGVVRMGEDPGSMNMVSSVSPSGTSNSMIMYNLTRARWYYYTVTVTDESGASKTSAVKSFRTLSN